LTLNILVVFKFNGLPPSSNFNLKVALPTAVPSVFITDMGIKTEIRNQHLGGIMGEMPVFETWPQLWVVNELEFDRATQLIEAADSESHEVPWTCRKCGEKNEGQYAACWNCEASAD
jgi:hypothetical protein